MADQYNKPDFSKTGVFSDPNIAQQYQQGGVQALQQYAERGSSAAAREYAAAQSTPRGYLKYSELNQPTINLTSNGRIQVNAPQSFLDSTYYQEQVRPTLDSYIGANVTDPEAMAKYKADIQTIFNAAANSWTLAQTQREVYGQMSDEEADEIQQIYAVANEAGDSQVLEDTVVPAKLWNTGEDETGDWIHDWFSSGTRGQWSSGITEQEQTAKEFLDEFKNWSDQSKSIYLDSLQNTLTAPGATGYQKGRAAALLSLINNASANNSDYRGMLDARTGSKVYNALAGFSSGLVSSNTAGTLQAITGQDRTPVETLNNNLSGANDLTGWSSLAGGGIGMLADMYVGSRLPAAANKLTGITALTKAGDAMKITRLQNGIATLFGGGVGGGKVANIWRVLDPVGSIAYGGWSAAVNSGIDEGYSKDPLGSFAKDMLGNALFYGGIKGLSYGAKAVSKTAPIRFLNRNINKVAIKVTGSKLGKRLSTIASTPEEAASRLAARQKDAEASQEWLEARRAAKKAGEDFDRLERIGYYYAENENKLARKRMAQSIIRYREGKGMEIEDDLRRAAGMDVSDQAEQAVENVATAPSGQVDEAVDDAIGTIEEGLQQEARTYPEPTKEPTVSEREEVSAVDTDTPDLKAQQENVDSNKVKDVEQRRQVDSETSSERMVVDNTDHAMATSENSDLFGEKKIREIKDPKSKKTVKVQDKLPDNFSRWANDRSLLTDFSATQTLDDIAQKMQRGVKDYELSPREREILAQYRDSRGDPSAIPSRQVSSQRQRDNLDQAVSILEKRIADNPISKNKEALGLAEQQFAALKNLHAKIQDIKSNLGIGQFDKAGLNRNRRNPRFKDYLKTEPIAFHTNASTARGGRRSKNYVSITQRPYYDPLTAAEHDLQGIADQLHMRQQEQIQSAMKDNGGATVHQTEAQLLLEDRQLEDATKDLRGMLESAQHENPDLDFGDVNKMFNYTAPTTADEIIQRGEAARQKEKTVSGVLKGSTLERDMSKTLDTASRASQLKKSNPGAFLKNTFSVQIGDSVSSAERVMRSYNDNAVMAANNPNAYSLKASNFNIVDMNNNVGTKFVDDVLKGIPDDQLNLMTQAQRTALNNVRFGRPGASLQDVIDNPRVRNYLEMQGIHGIQSPTEGFVQVSPNARLFNTSTSKDAIFTSMNQSGTLQENVEFAAQSAAEAMAENYKHTLYSDEKAYQNILRMAYEQGVSPDAIVASILKTNGKIKRGIADTLWQNSENGLRNLQKQTQSIVGLGNEDIMPSGWQPGDRLLTKDDFDAQVKLNKDGTPNKSSQKEWDKKWEKFDKLQKDKDYINAAKSQVEWTKDDFRKLADDYFQQRADDIVRFDSLTPEQRKDIRDVSSASSEIESTGGKSKRDIKRNKISENQTRENITPEQSASEAQAVEDASTEAVENAATTAQPEESGAPEVKWSDDKVSSVTSGATDGGENSTLTGDKYITEAVKAQAGGSKSYGNVGGFLNATNRLYRFFTTTINSVTWFKNAVRDAGLSFITAGTMPVDFIKSNVMNPVGYIKNSPDIYNRFLERFNGDSQALDDYLVNLFTDMRGPMGGISEASYFHGDAAETKNRLKKVCGNAINILESPSTAIEQSQRMLNGSTKLMSLIQQGYDAEYAAQMALFTARHATTDFSQGLGQLERFRRMSVYFGATVNGTRSFIRMASIDPAGLTVRLATGILTPIIYCTASNLTDPNKKARYEAISEEDKEANLIFITKDGNAIYLPLTQEVYAYTNLARKFTERLYGENSDTWGQIAMDGALDLSPFDISWLADLGQPDEFGQPQNPIEQIGNGVAKVASEFAPAIASPIYGFATGRSLYFGDELSGYSDIDSPTYNAVANFLGFPMDSETERADSIAKIKNAISGTFGTMSNWFINSLDQALGAPEEKAGGKSFLDSVAEAVGGERSYDAASTKFFDAVDSAEKQKQKLKNKLADLDKKSYDATDDEKQQLYQQRQDLINEYTQDVGEIFNKWGQMFKITGGITESRKRQIINLLNLGSDEATGLGDYGSYAADQASDAGREEYYDALERYEQTGLQDPTGPILPYRTRTGEWATTTPSIAIQNAINRSYGTPKEMVYDVQNAMSKENADGVSLWDIRNQYKEQINNLYDEADANGTTPDYDAIADLQYQFLEEFDKYMKPVIDKYGEFIVNNYDVVDELRGMLSNMIPSETYQKDKYGRFRSMPLMEVDLQEWLQKRYGIGQGNLSGMPSDEEVTNAVNRINEAIRNGRLAQAQALAQRINNRIGRGEVYATGSDMDTISNVLGY